MIKVGIKPFEGISSLLVRMLLRHPDTEIAWIASGGIPVYEMFDDLLEGEEIPVVDWDDEDVDLSEITLYIGDDNDKIRDALKENSELKAVFPHNTSSLDDLADIVVGVCEFNRKALVRGARLAVQPDVSTLLGALALMPLAKNLMLNNSVSGTMIMPVSEDKQKLSGNYDLAKFSIIPVGENAADRFESLRREILGQLQNSLGVAMGINVIETTGSDFACAVLSVDIKLSASQAMELYRDFYSDHRHVYFPKNVNITDRMVRGTNHTAIALSNDSLGKLIITVGFDSRYKAGAGNILHIVNLLFGLDERTGF